LRQLGAEPHEVTALAQGVARGDLRQPITLPPGDQHSMMAQLKTMQLSLADVVGHVRSASEAVAIASMQIAQGKVDLSACTEHQASMLQQTAASMEQLNGRCARPLNGHARPSSWRSRPRRSSARRWGGGRGGADRGGVQSRRCTRRG
jgi:methyl-accepting chemotaxis protein